MSLADLDDLAESAGQRRPAAELPQAWLANGTWTITFPCGTHKTLRIHTQQAGQMAGKRLVSLLIGPENTTDYENFAELTPAGPWVWKRWKNKKPDEYVQLLWAMLKGEKIEDHELKASLTCLRCNRPLTDPVSIESKLGPECRRRERA